MAGTEIKQALALLKSIDKSLGRISDALEDRNIADNVTFRKLLMGVDDNAKDEETETGSVRE